MKAVDFDREIAAAESRIMSRRRLLGYRIRRIEALLRAKISSPEMLLSVAGIGYVLGRLTMRKGARASPLRRLWGTLTQAASAAFSLMHSAPMLWLAGMLGAARSQSQPAEQQSHL
jgi:hypothetical protein